MITLIDNGVFLVTGNKLVPNTHDVTEKLQKAGFDEQTITTAKERTISYDILKRHNTSDNMTSLKIRFDSLASHDITYVGIIQTARASGLTEFPIPYVLTNCHNSLCAVGGTINEDDHVFGLTAAQKYGGIYVPAHQAVIHSFMREMQSGCGRMILGSDSHTRYGALGTMAIGEGGPELVKQLLSKTYDIEYPKIVAVHLKGAPRPGVGPQDVALAIIGAVFESGFVKNCVLEFVGEGIASLPMDYRNGIDVMTTETTCLSSIWVTDDKTEEYFDKHLRPDAYSPLAPGNLAYYDKAIEVDLDKIECMIAMPFHPSNTYTIKDLNANAADILRKIEKDATEILDLPGIEYTLTDKLTERGILAQQGVIAGCAGGIFDNLCAAADILKGSTIGNGEFSVSAYPASQPVMMELTRNGVFSTLMQAGVTIRTAFCGPCFGAGDVPANGALSLRHTTRNFPNREGSKPAAGQIASVALMDARSIAATAKNGGILTPATDFDVEYTQYDYKFDDSAYKSRVYFGYGKADNTKSLKFGPNITDWPQMYALTDDLLMQAASVITDPVTTTDELIPSGETSSYRSNPLKLAEFTLSRKDPGYVSRAKAAQLLEDNRRRGIDNPELAPIYSAIAKVSKASKPANIGIGSFVFAIKPGDGSAREQAASCQRVLGGVANIANEYATKRYRSNLINWGMLPLLIDAEEIPFSVGDYVFLPGIRNAIENNIRVISAYVITPDGEIRPFTVKLDTLTDDERKIILMGCLINFYRENS
ncbi:MAG: hydratase [Clostridiales bacterium]|nr:hydratase [Clostridiales bacterium]